MMKTIAVALIGVLIAMPALACHKRAKVQTPTATYSLNKSWEGHNDRGRGDWRGDWHGPRPGGWGPWHRPEHHNNVGDVIGGAIIGGVISNLFFPPKPAVVVVPEAPEGPAPWTQAWYDYCIGKYRSFDAKTGYYQGFDGVPHFCK